MNKSKNLIAILLALCCKDSTAQTVIRHLKVDGGKLKIYTINPKSNTKIMKPSVVASNPSRNMWQADNLLQPPKMFLYEFQNLLIY